MKVKNLLSRFQKIVEWSLVIRSFVFVLVALSAFVYGGAFLWGAFLIFSLWFFYQEGEERVSYIASYFVFVLLTFLYGTHVRSQLVVADIVFFVSVLGALMVWQGIIRFFFRKREQALDLYHTLLIFYVVLFTLVVPGFHYIVGAGVGIGYLCYEYMRAYRFPWRSRLKLASAVHGYSAIELLLIGRVLPLHSVVVAGIVTISLLVIRNLSVRHFSGTLTREYLFQHIAIFLFLCISLFATGRWVF